MDSRYMIANKNQSIVRNVSICGQACNNYNLYIVTIITMCLYYNKMFVLLGNKTKRGGTYLEKNSPHQSVAIGLDCFNKRGVIPMESFPIIGI